MELGFESMIRRLFALASLLLLLNVSAAEALRVCASQANHPAATPAPVSDAHQHHHGAPAEKSDKDCETPKSTQCCNALSSCGATLDLGGAAEVASVIPDGGQPLRGLARAPVTRVFSPEPPPPKGRA